MIDKLITFYLDYQNSGVSTEAFAAKYEVSVSECCVLISAGASLADLQTKI